MKIYVEPNAQGLAAARAVGGPQADLIIEAYLNPTLRRGEQCLADPEEEIDYVDLLRRSLELVKK